MTKQMKHAEYQRALKVKSPESLRYIIKDARAAITVMPNSVNVGYYTDEIHYVYMELKRRNILVA